MRNAIKIEFIDTSNSNKSLSRFITKLFRFLVVNLQKNDAIPLKTCALFCKGLRKNIYI